MKEKIILFSLGILSIVSCLFYSFLKSDNFVKNRLLSYVEEGVDVKYTPSSDHINVILNINDINIDRCNFSIDNKEAVEIKNVSGKCSYNFDKLESNQEYKISVSLINKDNSSTKVFEETITTLTNLSDYVISLKNDILSQNNLYFHDSHLTSGAQDDSYRYSGNDVNNWVCFGTSKDECKIDNLYRIIGTFKNEYDNKYQIKLITSDYASEESLGINGNRNNTYEFGINANYKGNREKIHTYYWINQSESISNNWNDSLLNSVNLNENFYENLGEWKYIVLPLNWIIKGLSENELQNGNASDIYKSELFYNDLSNNIYNDEIGLLYVSDYMYAAYPKYWLIKASDFNESNNDNWLHLGANEWTISKNSDNGSKVFYINEKGNIKSFEGNKMSFAIRPTFYIHDYVGFISGDGTKTDPFLIIPNQEMPKHKINYIGFENNDNYPKEITDGNDLIITFSETIDKDHLFVMVGGKVDESYTFNNNSIEIKNIKGDVEIFNFNLQILPVENQINFPRTSDPNDYDTILTTETPVTLKISKNIYPVTYEISVVNSDKFTLSEGETVTKTIDGGSLKNEDITVTLKIKDLTKTDDTVKIRVTSTFPYSKTFEFDYKVTQDGAIQYIEDLVDMALAIRDRANPNNIKKSAVQSQRFKMTRNLDFNDSSSYKDASSDAYGDINGNDNLGGNIYNELTSDTGFLPIGELQNPFMGAFNGGGHTLSNLRIQKALQKNIGFFGTTEGATIKNLTIEKGNVYNHNQTAGMLVGKFVGGLIEDVTISGDSVLSTDEQNLKEDTYSGGVVGYVTDNATIRNCVNKAQVTTKFTGDTTEYSGPAGGITGWMAHSTIENCQNYGEIIGQSYVGGIAGFSGMQTVTGGNGGGTITGCTNYGNVHTYSGAAGKHIGGIAGYNKLGGSITGNTNAAQATVNGVSNVGGIVGNNAGSLTNNTNYSKNITGSTTSSVGKIYGFQSSTGTQSGNKDLSNQ